MAYVSITCDNVEVESNSSREVTVNLNGVSDEDVLDQLSISDQDFLKNISIEDAIEYYGEDVLLDHLGVDKEVYEELVNRYELT